MNVFQIIENLYVNKEVKWINEIDDSEIEPFIIQKFLLMNDNIRIQVRWLDKYVFSIPSKMWLSLAWTVIPKYNKSPFVKYIKKVEEEQEYSFILNEIRKHFKLSDNDFKHNKSRIIEAVKKDMVGWFKFYGIPKKYWKQYYLNFDLIRTENKEKVKCDKALGAWGI